jgi:deoxyribonuclease V
VTWSIIGSPFSTTLRSIIRSACCDCVAVEVDVRLWPSAVEELVTAQRVLASASPPPWRAHEGMRIGGCVVCFERGPSGPGRASDRGWAAAALGADVALHEGAAGAAYAAGLLALREGELLEAAVRALRERPDVLLVNAIGRDHPRSAGLALQLGAVLDLPTVGVTHRPLLAAGEWQADERDAKRPLLLAGERVGSWLRTRPGTRPLAVHAAWRTDADTALMVVRASLRGARTPEPLRLARQAARAARAAG